MRSPCENERQAGAVIHKPKADFESAHVHEASLAFEFNSCDLCCVAAVTGRARRVESTHSPLLNVFACWRQPVAEAVKKFVIRLSSQHQLSHDLSVFCSQRFTLMTCHRPSFLAVLCSVCWVRGRGSCWAEQQARLGHCSWGKRKVIHCKLLLFFYSGVR